MGIVLRLEHQVQRVEHRPFDVPVIAMRLAIQALGIAEHLSECARDLFLASV
jgi:hypothetical protein